MRKGSHFTEVQIAKLSKAHKGIPSSRKGVKLSEETKEKLRQANLGKKYSEATRRKVSEAGLGRKHTEETKRKMGIAMSGENNPAKRPEVRAKISKILTGRKNPDHAGEKHWNWQGGITPINRKIRNTIEYKQWRTAVFGRDNWTCVRCGDRSRKGHPVILQADHIKLYALYPELTFDINNGQTLCYPCHRVKTSEDMKMLISTKTNWGKHNRDKLAEQATKELSLGF